MLFSHPKVYHMVQKYFCLRNYLIKLVVHMQFYLAGLICMKDKITQFISFRLIINYSFIYSINFLNFFFFMTRELMIKLTT